MITPSKLIQLTTILNCAVSSTSEEKKNKKDDDEDDQKKTVEDPKSKRINLSTYAPILTWLPKYTSQQALGDFIAGVTLGLTMIPQSIAYATLAGLTPQYGLYSSFLGGFMYAIFGSVKEISIGPTSLMALLTLEFTRETNIDFVIFLTFISGCVEFLMGSLNLGFLVDFISLPVTSGFTSATSVIIIGSQLKGLLGLKFKSANFIEQITKIVQNLPNVRIPDTVLGITSIVVLLLLRKLKDVEVKDSKVLSRLYWFMSVGRNALVVLSCSVVSFYLYQSNNNPFVLSGRVESGLPPFGIPKFSTSLNNQTLNFVDMCARLRSGIVVTPLVSVLANVAIAKVFSSGSSSRLNASQEMRTLGLCNLVGSCFSSMPTAGAFTRSAVSRASGIETPLAGIYSGMLTIFALSFLTPYFYYIPKPVLSAVLISAVVFLIDWQIVQRLWHGNKKDAVATVGTFVICICLNVEAGLLLGIISNILYLLYLSARPGIKVTECKINSNSNDQNYLLVQPDLGLFFPAVDFLANKIGDIARGSESPRHLVIDCARFRGVDYTAVKGLEKLSLDFESKRLQTLWFLNLNPKVVKSINKLGDKKNQTALKILDSEAELVALLCGYDTTESKSIKVCIIENKEKNTLQEINSIPMKTIESALPEAESLLTITQLQENNLDNLDNLDPDQVKLAKSID